MVLSTKSREEIKFLALLEKTQEKAANIDFYKNRSIGLNNDVFQDGSSDSLETETDWRFPKYVETLAKWLEDLKHHPQGPSKEVFKEYQTKVDFLHKVVTSYSDQGKESDNFLKVEDHGHGRRNSSFKSDFQNDARRRSIREESPFHGQKIEHGGKVDAHLLIPHGPASTGDPITKQIHQKIAGRHELSIRDELFGTNESGIRYRGRKNDELDEDDLSSLIKAHHADQEQIAEEMISLTRTLKDHALVSAEIINKDVRTVEKMGELADTNTSRLNVESDRLSEARSTFSCRCWIWLLIGSVSITFIVMVWVMKLFRKRRDMVEDV